MTRIMFPYIGFISLVSLSAGILNTWKRFAVPAATPVLLNLAMIAAVWLAGAVFARLRDRERSTPWPPASCWVACSSWRCRSRRWRDLGVLPRIGAGLRAWADAWRHPGVRTIAAPDGAGAARRLGGAAVDPDQHPDRLAPGRRRGLVAVLRRPADGVPDLAARRRARRSADPAALGGAGRAATPRATRECSTGACAWRCLLALPCAAALLVFPEALVATLFERGKFDAARRRQDGAGAARLRRRPDRPDRRQDPGAGLLRAPGPAHAGDDRGHRPGADAGDERALRPLPRPRRPGAVGEPRGDDQRGLALRRPEARRLVPARARLGPLRPQGGVRDAGAERLARASPRSTSTGSA